MKNLGFLTLTLALSTICADPLSFDPEDPEYEKNVFNFINSFGPGVFDDPYFDNLVSAHIFSRKIPKHFLFFSENKWYNWHDGAGKE